MSRIAVDPQQQCRVPKLVERSIIRYVRSAYSSLIAGFVGNIKYLSRNFGSEICLLLAVAS